MEDKLIKKYNELYFRDFQDTKLVKLDSNTSQEALENILAIADDIDTELFYIAHDIFELKFGAFPDTFTPLSDLLCDMIDKNIELSTFVDEVIYSTISEVTEQVQDILARLSKNACYVGGCVRDAVREVKPKDFDFCTDTDIYLLEAAFERNGFKVDNVGKQFLVLIVSKNGEQFEIANFRKDKDNQGGEAGTIFDDGHRRDFTVNAGYFNINSRRIIDPTGKFIEDIETKTLRFVGKAEDRLNEDPIRAMRFYRFTARGFKPDSKSLKAVRSRVQNDSKRVNELQLVLNLPGVQEAIETALEFQRNDTKMVKRAPTVTMTKEKLSETILSLERIRLEVEKMAGL